MKFYKLRWLIYFFLYKFNRWLGGKTKWEKKGNTKIPQYEKEEMMKRIFWITLKLAVDELARIWKKLYGGKMCRCAMIPFNKEDYPELMDSSFDTIVPVWIPDDEVENYLKFREQFTKDFDKRWHGIHKRFE